MDNDTLKMNEEDVRLFANIMRELKYKKGTIIIFEGQISTHRYLIKKGLIRVFYLKEGKDISEFFGFENTGFSCLDSLYLHTPTEFYVEALEDCTLYAYSKDSFDELCRANIKFALLNAKMLEYILIMLQKRLRSVQFYTAEERYQNLIKYKPAIFQRVPLKHIASYLGVTSETLSRLRVNK
jgi:CRP-like cAMP-binding protein